MFGALQKENQKSLECLLSSDWEIVKWPTMFIKQGDTD